MTVETLVSKQNQAGTGAQTVFLFTFKATDTSWIHAYIDDVEEPQADLTVALNADQNNNPGGSVTFDITIPANGTVVTLSREVDLKQLTNYTAYDAFPSSSHEDALDKLTYQTQELSDAIARALKLPISELSGGSLAPVATRASKYLAFDGLGDFVYLAGTAETPNAVLRPGAAATGNLMEFDANKNAVDSGKTAEQLGLLDVQVFTVSGTWNKPSGTEKVEVVCIGGGAGGGGLDASSFPAGTNTGGYASAGGGGGALTYDFIAAGIGASEAVTVGAGGAGGAGATPADGDAGGDSSFGTLTVAKGGRGGNSLTANTSTHWATNFPGGGGLSSGATISGEGYAIEGDDSTYAMLSVIATHLASHGIEALGDSGGRSPLGGRYISPVKLKMTSTGTSISQEGIDAPDIYPGAGGSGATAIRYESTTIANNIRNGGDGANGMVIVKSYG